MKLEETLVGMRQGARSVQAVQAPRAKPVIKEARPAMPRMRAEPTKVMRSDHPFDMLVAAGKDAREKRRKAKTGKGIVLGDDDIGPRAAAKSLRKMKGFTATELEGLRTQFDNIDNDNNGLLDKDEMKRFYVNSGIDVQFVDISFLIFRKKDEDSFTYDEFIEFMAISEQMDTKPRLFYKKVFNAMDLDGNGAIDADELVKFCALLHSPISAFQAATLIKSVDARKINAMLYDDLCRYIGLI